MELGFYRPDDLLWGGGEGLYLDKGFNVKFSYQPKLRNLPAIAIGLDDFAGACPSLIDGQDLRSL